MGLENVINGKGYPIFEAFFSPSKSFNITGVRVSFMLERKDAVAADEHCAFYLLTPHRMEYIKKLYELDKRIFNSFCSRAEIDTDI